VDLGVLGWGERLEVRRSNAAAVPAVVVEVVAFGDGADEGLVDEAVDGGSVDGVTAGVVSAVVGPAAVWLRGDALADAVLAGAAGVLGPWGLVPDGDGSGAA